MCSQVSSVVKVTRNETFADGILSARRNLFAGVPAAGDILEYGLPAVRLAAVLLCGRVAQRERP